MYVIRVVPLASLPPNAPQVLDYYWPSPLPRGSVVRAGLGRRIVVAVVVGCEDLRRGKLAVKRADFQLKKLSGVIADAPQLSERQLALAEWLSQQYATGLSTSLRSVAPSFIGTRGSAMDMPASTTLSSEPARTRLILARPDGAFAEVERIIAARGRGQTAVVVPEIALAAQFAARLSSHDPVIVHSAVSIRALRAAHRAVASGAARLVIGTRASLALPWHDLSDMVMEDPQHEAYKSDRAPRLNAADVAREVARLHGARLTYLAPSLTVVQRYLGDRNALDIEERRGAGPTFQIVSTHDELASGNRTLFSREAQRALQQAVDARTPVLVYSTRRAYATALRCDACGSSVPCATCGIPMRLHRTTEDMLVCYHCAAYTRVPAVCPGCRTGKLRPAGLAGSQRITETIARLTGQTVPILDSDLVTSDADARGVWHAFDEQRSPVLVATQMVLPYRYVRSFGLIIVPQADVLGSDADFRAAERAQWQIEKLADFGPQTIILQSWEPSAMRTLTDPAARDTWYRDELDDRRTLAWPPYTRLVRCTVSDRIRTRAQRDATVVADRLRRAVAHEGLKGTTVMGPVPAMVERAGGIWVHHILIKTRLAGSSLARFLRYVPPQATVDVDPRSIA